MSECSRQDTVELVFGRDPSVIFPPAQLIRVKMGIGSRDPMMRAPLRPLEPSKKGLCAIGMTAVYRITLV